jgi:hypothetical protein
MNTQKSIILAAIGTAASFYLAYLYSKLPTEIHNKVYQIASLVILGLAVFALLFLMLNGSKKPETPTPPTEDNDKNFTDIND